MSRFWQLEEIEKLIDLVKQHPCLWDAQEPGYNDTDTRYEAYKEIGRQLELHPEVVRSKFRNLRAQYFRIDRDPAKRTRPRRWAHFDALNFLSKHSKVENEVTKTMSMCSKGDNGSETDDLIEEVEESYDEDFSDQLTKTEREISRKKKKPHSGPKATTLVMEAAVKAKDAHTIFGEHVASELRNLKHDKRLQQTLKCAIITAILQANQAFIS